VTAENNLKATQLKLLVGVYAHIYSLLLFSVLQLLTAVFELYRKAFTEARTDYFYLLIFSNSGQPLSRPRSL